MAATVTLPGNRAVTGVHTVLAGLAVQVAGMVRS